VVDVSACGGWVLLVVLVADVVGEFDFFEDLFGDGGVVAVGAVVAAEGHLVVRVVLSYYYTVNN